MSISDSDRDFLIGALADEFAERHRRGERPLLEEYTRRYPDLAERIRELFPAVAKTEGGDEGRESVAGGAAAHGPHRVGDYRLLREIGRGGMGVVFEAEQLSLGRRVALKVLPFHASKNARAIERFRHEARSAAKLHHTNIVPVFEVGQEGDVCYYAMQLIEGQGLDQVIADLLRVRSQADPPPPAATAPPDGPTLTRRSQPSEIALAVLTGRFQAGELEFTVAPPGGGSALGMSTSLPDIESHRRHYFQGIARIIYQAATALAFAHERGIIHRDVKPSNLLLDTEGVVWVTDFGLAKAVGGDNLTHSGDVVGTIRYMAPERFRGEADAISDLYSLGLTLYELLVLRPAFDSPDRLHLVEQVKNHEPVRPRAIDPRIPRDLETIVLKSIEKDARRRYASAEDLAEDLHRFLADEPIKARQVSAAGRVLRWTRRNRAVAASFSVIAVLLVASVIGSGVAALHFRDQERRNAQLAKEAEAGRRRAVEAKEHEAALRREAEDARALAQSRAEQNRQNLYNAEMNLAGKSAELPSGFRRVNELLANWRPVDHQPDLRGWEFYYLQSLCHVDLFTLRGHFASVVSVCWSPDRTRLASASTDSTVRVWDASTGRQVLTLRGHSGNVWSVAWSPDGTRLASAGEDATVKVRKAETGQDVVTLRGHTRDVHSVVWSPDGSRLASGGDDGTVRVWDAGAGKELLAIPAGAAAIRSVAWSPDGLRLASAGDDRTVRVWDAGTGAMGHALRGHLALVGSLAWSPDGSRLASASWDWSVKVWPLKTEGLRGQARGREGEQDRGETEDDSGRIASRLFPVPFSPSPLPFPLPPLDLAALLPPKSGEAPLTLRGHNSLVRSVAWGPDGSRLATTGEDGTVRVWDAGDGRNVFSLSGHTGPVHSVCWDRDGGRLASASWDQTIKVWSADPAPGRPPETGAPPRSAPELLAASWSPDGSRLATLARDGAATVRDATTGRELLALRQRPTAGWNGSLAWNPEGSRLATACDDGTVAVWDTRTGENVLALRGHTGPALSVAWNPDGSRLASGGGDGMVRVWDAGTGKEERALKGHTLGVGSLAWSPDGKALATGGWDWSVILWDVDGGRPRRTLRGHFDAVRSVCWSPDGSRLATTGDDATIKVWDVQDGRARLTLRGHFWRVWSVAWNPDGSRLASASLDATVRVWEVGTGSETLSLRGHTGPVRSVAWSPDGLRLASAGDDGTALVLDATPGCVVERSPRLLPLLDRRIASGRGDADDLRLRCDVLARRGEWARAAADFESAGATGSRPASPWYSTGWWVIGPYPEDMNVPYPPETDPDPFGSLAHPALNARPGGVPSLDERCWRAADPVAKEYLDFGNLFDHAEHISAYAVARVYSPEARPVAILFGADDTARIWLNGRKVHETLINRGATPDRDSAPASFRKGWNTLLVRVSNTNDTHGLHLRISDAPEDRALALVNLARFDEAAGLVEEALARTPDRPGLEQLAARIRVERRQNDASEGRWGRVAADLAREIEVAPEEPRKWFHGAVALLAAGKVELYDRQRLAMLRRFGDARDWVTAERISKACLLRPGDPPTTDRAARLALRGLEDAPENPWALFAAGLAAYRTGDPLSALDRLKRGRDAGTVIERSEAPCYEACTFLVQAMSNARLDRAAAALESLGQADRLLEGRFPREGSANQYPSPWPDWALCQLLWREAQQVVRGPGVTRTPGRR